MTVQPLALALLACMAAAPLISAPAQAATPINQTRPMDANGRIDIENLKGRIEVRAWDKRQVRITGSLGNGVEQFVIEGDAQHLSVHVRYPRRSNDNNSEPTVLILDVPRGSNLEIDGVSADISVLGTAGSTLDIESVSGDVIVGAAPREANIDSVSGDVRANLHSRMVDVESVSGDITLRGRLNGEIDVETVSGNVTIDSQRQRVRRVDFASVSGDADIRVALADGGSIKTESVSGDATLHLPKSLSARIRGESFSGDLDIPGANVIKTKYGPGSSVEHRY
ncbi:MAG: DUF4097 domain-containing protein, partial [Pseudomonadota bacterium]|nr:DUF4097 domain-containing protein [Pseudomonadota bacterium]